MPVEFIGMVGTREASEIKGPLVDGPVVDWTEGSVIEPGYLEDISRAHEDAGFDRVLIGYGAVSPEGWAVASTVLQRDDAIEGLGGAPTGLRATGAAGADGRHTRQPHVAEDVLPSTSSPAVTKPISGERATSSRTTRVIDARPK
jgi:hypothetical protein